MLAAAQKAVILRRSGIAVPPLPEEAANEGGVEPDAVAAGGVGASVGHEAAREGALRQWTAQVNALFVSYVAARAAKSLRDAEEARQMNELRHLASSRGWAGGAPKSA